MYKVTEKDLIGGLKGFPIEVVQLMLQRQFDAGNPVDVTVFQRDVTSGTPEKGFTWTDTPEGHLFWNIVIDYNHFNIFFEKYPKGTIEISTGIGNKKTEEKEFITLHKKSNLKLNFNL